MTGGFHANDTAKQTAQGILDQGADVILPVGGPIYQSARDAIADGGTGTVMLGVDSDLAAADPSVADIVLVSIMKRIDQAVYEATMEACDRRVRRRRRTSARSRTRASASSGFGAFESRAAARACIDELDALQEQIISGELEVTSPSSP